MSWRFFLVVLLFVAACQPITKQSESLQTRTPTVVTPTPTSTHLFIQSQDWVYKTIYQNGSFAIRESNLGHIDWSVFEMPPSRIDNTVVDFNPRLQNNTGWCQNPGSLTDCSITINIENSSRQTVIFKLWCNSGFSARECKLFKNEGLIWNGKMNGGTGDPIDSIKKIGTGLAISYADSDWPSGPHTIQLILLTNEHGVTEIKRAFTPNELLGKLIYFLDKDGKVVLDFANQEVGSHYDRVFNQRCCWDGPPIQIYSNGQIIDFFAIKEDNWYHVQAGDATYLASLNTEGK
jgi:hypothetical protein